jgi:hypothetical protein
MRRVLRRETFIALRARRQAHQIASEIQNPELQIEPPPDPFAGRPRRVKIESEPHDPALAPVHLPQWLTTPHPSVVRSLQETRRRICTVARGILIVALLAVFLAALLLLASTYYPPQRN